MNRVWFFPSDWKSELEQLRNLKVLWRSSVTSLKIRSVCRKSALFSNMLWVSTCLKICCMSQWEEVLNFLNWGGFCPPWGRARRSSHSCSSTTQWWLEPCEPGPSCVLGGPELWASWGWWLAVGAGMYWPSGLLFGKSVPDHESGELCNGEVVLGREAAVLRGEM